MLDNTIASTFNDIPLHIRSSLNVKLFKAHSKRFYSTFSWLSTAFLFFFFLSKRLFCFFLANSEKHFYQMKFMPIKNIYIYILWFISKPFTCVNAGDTQDLSTYTLHINKWEVNWNSLVTVQTTIQTSCQYAIQIRSFTQNFILGEYVAGFATDTVKSNETHNNTKTKCVTSLAHTTNKH